MANGKGGTFANNGLPGQVPTPILDKLFAGLPSQFRLQQLRPSSPIFTQNNIYTMFNTIRTSDLLSRM